MTKPANKIFPLVISVMLLLAFGTSAQAKVRNFDRFSIDVPDGWSVEENKENYTVAFISPDESSALTISMIENDGVSAEEYAKRFMKEMSGYDLRKFNDNSYQFLLKDGDITGRAIVSADENYVLFLTGVGENSVMDGMVSSMQPL